MFLTSFHMKLLVWKPSGKQKVGTGVRWQQTAAGSRGRCAATDWALETRAALPPLRIHLDCDQSKQRFRLICRHGPPFFFVCMNSDLETTASADACEHAATCANRDGEQMVIVAQRQIQIEQIIWVLNWDFCSVRKSLVVLARPLWVFFHQQV